MKTVNATGIAEIHAFLAENHKLGGDHFDAVNLAAYAREADFQLREGNPPSIELEPHQTVSGHAQNYTISAAGIDTVVENDD